MKKPAAPTFLSVLFLTFLLVTSCKHNDDSSETIDEGETQGDYFPLALNNDWNFHFSESDDKEINLYSTLDFEGETYFITEGINPVDGSDLTQGYRKSGAVYYCYNDEMTFSYSGLADIYIDPVAFVIFKDDLEEGETVVTEATSDTQVVNPFTGTVNTTTSFTFTTTLLQKDISWEVNGVTYEDVIKVQLDAHAESLGEVFDGTVYYYFAKNVGPIQLETEVGTYTLTTYTLN